VIRQRIFDSNLFSVFLYYLFDEEFLFLKEIFSKVRARRLKKYSGPVCRLSVIISKNFFTCHDS